MEKMYQTINCNGRLVDLAKPKVMGILNLTPDSFSDGGQYNSPALAMKQVEKMLYEGADIIDIGAQSTRPNAERVSSEEEIARIGNMIALIKKEFPEALISLDSFYAKTIQFGYNEGIDIVNDISAGQFDENLLTVVAKTKLPYVLMHIPPTYDKMHQTLIEGNVVLEINRFFSEKIQVLKDLGIKDILLDAGFGFGKTIPQQEQMMEELEYIGFEDYPLLVGISRKSFIYKPLGKSPLEIEEETQKLHLKALEKGAKLLRTHNVKNTKKVVEAFMCHLLP